MINLKKLTVALGFAALGLAATSSMATTNLNLGDTWTDTGVAVDGTTTLSDTFGYTFGAGVTKASFTFDFADTGSLNNAFKVSGVTPTFLVGGTTYDAFSDTYGTHYTFDVTGAQLHAGSVAPVTVQVSFKTGYQAGFDSVNHNTAYSLNVAAVPEPESYAMLLAGLGLVASIVRRRAKSV